MLEQKKKMNELQEKEVAEVSGGGTTVELPANFYEIFKEVSKKCRMCGKEFKRTICRNTINWGGQPASWSYYEDLCDDCSTQNPYVDNSSLFFRRISKSESGS